MMYSPPAYAAYAATNTDVIELGSDSIRYLIQWDNASKRFPYRVLTICGTCRAYFRTQTDAVQFCGSAA